MKKLLLSLLMCASLAACKKVDDLKPDPELAKSAVQFTLADFTQDASPIGKADASVSAVGDTLKNYANYLYYRVYNSSGALVKSKSQTSSEAAFGTITDSLAQGNYTVVFAASVKALTFANSSLANDYFQDQANSYWEDTFYKKISLIVGTSPVNQSVRLDRIVAGLQLNIQEDLPLNIVTLEIVAQDDDKVFKLATNSGDTSAVKKRSWNVYVNNTKRKSVLMHILNTTRPQQITINGYNAGGEKVISRVINNVGFYANKKTVFSGDLSVTVDLNIKVNPTWSTPTDPIRY